MATAKTARTSASGAEAFEQATNDSSQAFRENIDRSLAAMSEASAFGKENFEAVIASAASAQKGFEAVSTRSLAFSKQTLENQLAATKSLMGAKSVQEFVEKQNEYAKASFEVYVAELSSLSDMAAGLAKDALAPITQRVSAAGQIIQAGAPR